jgi:hypothetical protein
MIDREPLERLGAADHAQVLAFPLEADHNFGLIVAYMAASKMRAARSGLSPTVWSSSSASSARQPGKSTRFEDWIINYYVYHTVRRSAVEGSARETA